VDDFEAALQEKIYGGRSFSAGEKVEVRSATSTTLGLRGRGARLGFARTLT